MKKYHIKLAASERSELAAIVKKQKINAQKKLRAQIRAIASNHPVNPPSSFSK
jgi:hypothetical protein